MIFFKVKIVLLNLYIFIIFFNKSYKSFRGAELTRAFPQYQKVSYTRKILIK